MIGLILSYGVLLAVLVSFPIVKKGPSTVMRLGLILRAMVALGLSIGVVVLFFKEMDMWWVIGLALVSLIPLILPKFIIIYKVSEKDIVQKIKCLLKRIFCEYKENGKKIVIKDIGTLKLTKVGFFMVLTISDVETSPKSGIVLKNLFKVFRDENYVSEGNG